MLTPTSNIDKQVSVTSEPGVWVKGQDYDDLDYERGGQLGSVIGNI